MSKHTKIPGVDGYAASRDGKIWSTDSNWRGLGERELVPQKDKNGYLRVRIQTGLGREWRRVHIMIALAFVGPRPSPWHEVCHANGDPCDNRAENLRWGTCSENAMDRVAHGRTHRPDWSDPEKRERWSAAMRNGKPRRTKGDRHV